MALEGWQVYKLKDRQEALKKFEGHRWPWEDPKLSRAEKVMEFVQDLTISSGELAGNKLKLRKFQRDFIEDIYRTTPDGSRPVRTAVLSMGRKNGKTQLAAALALAHLSGPEEEMRGEVYSCANDRNQAAKIFNEMQALIKRHEYLAARCSFLQNRKEIIDLMNESTYNALSREAKTKFGLSPSMCIYDELGQSDGRELYDAMDSAMGARKSPLMVVISTQAADDFGPLSMLIDYGLRVKKGALKDPTFHLTLYTTNPEDDPWSRKTWKKANPALADFRSLEDVKRQANQAQRMPSLENSFRNLILNQRVAAETPFINPAAWQACAGEATIPLGAKVQAALDLGSTQDLSALILIYQTPEGIFHVQPYFWLPGDPRAREGTDRVPYTAWIKQGLIYPSGQATNPGVVARKIAELAGQYRITSLAFDRWRMHEVKRELEAIGCAVPLVEHGQGFKDMSPAVDVLSRMIAQKRLRHGGNAPLTWNARNAVVVSDPAGNKKLDKSRSVGRIDGVVALCMAFSLAVVKVPPIIDPRALIG
jgi:phage terminase large subunit-like protein